MNKPRTFGHICAGAILLLASTITLSAAKTAADIHAQHRHLPGVFVGVTSGGGEDTLTFGVEYEWLVSERFGLGLNWERSPERHHGDGTAVGLATVNYHPGGGWKLTAGAGRERVFDKKSHRYELYRLGVARDFHVGKFGVAPAVNVDFVNHEKNVVWGVSITRAF